MADPKIYIRRSASPSKVPTNNQLDLGELAVNTRDGKLYLKQDQTAVGLGSTVVAVNPWSVGVGTNSYNTYFDVGSVGIGTTNPTTTIDIRGTISIGRTDVSGINSIRSVIDINSWEYNGVFKSVALEDGTPTDIYFKDDGTKMYILGDVGNDVNEYSLSTAWDVNTATFTTLFSIASQETAPLGLYFKPDGTRMYICGTTAVSPANADQVRSYTLSTPWSLVSGVTYDSKAYTTSDTTPQGLYFKSDGTKMYVVGSTGDAVYEYTLSTAWELDSTITLVNTFLIGATNTLNLPLTLTTPVGIAFNASGTEMYILDQTRDTVTRFDLSTAWDTTTASFYDNFYVGFQELTPTGIFYEESVSRAYVIGSSGDTVYQYNTAVPSLEFASSGISTRSSVILNNETRLNNRLYVTGDAHISSNTIIKGTLQVDSTTTIAGTISHTGSTATLNNTTAANTINLATGAVVSGSQKTINVGTGGALGSRLLVTIGPTNAGVNTVVINSGTNLFIGSGTSTGTALQPLQVTGGAYVSGNTGIGSTNPTSALTVVGDVNITGVVTASSFSGNATSATYANTAGIATYSNTSGISTYSNTSGIATYANTAGIATYASTSGIATYASAAGIATDLTPTSSVNTTGIITAFKFVGDGSGLTGITASGGSSQWVTTSAGIHTLSDVGIGTTSPVSKLDVYSSSFTGITLSQDSISFPGTRVGVRLNLSSTNAQVTYSRYTTAGLTNLFDISNDGNITPASNGSQILGGASNYWKDLYIGTIYNSQLSLIGSGTSTGTATQRLQVTGGAYISGNLGIGTTNPTAKLDVLGDVNVTGVITASVGVNAPFFINESTDDNNYYNIPFLSQTLVGGNAYRLLQVDNGGIRFNPGINALETQVVTSGVNGLLYLLTNNATKIGIVISPNNGEVGIGTTNPIAKLDVLGNANISGVITASSFSGNASSATYASSSGIATYATTAGIATYATTAGIATYATSSGVSTYSSVAGISTYATTAGVSTYASTSGIATYATSSGIATYSSVAGISTYASTAGIATNLSTTSSVNTTGIITALRFSGDGSTLTNVPPWGITGAGIHTLSNVGVGTTNPTTKLYVDGDGYFTGVVTATTFVGDLTGTATNANNLIDASGINAGTIDAARLSGTYNIDISGSSGYATTAGIATYAPTAGIATNVIGGVASLTQLNVSGISTLGVVSSGNIFSSGIVTATSFYGSAIGLSGIGEGNTYYVSIEGSDTNVGDGINRPFRTVKQALSIATSGDLVQVGVGTFTEIFPLTVPQGVGVRGSGIRGTFIEPTSGTKQSDCFLLNGETEITDLTIGNMYEPGWAFRFANNMKTNIRSPYVQSVTVLNRGTTITSTDPYGFDTVHNPPTSYKAGRGALIDGSVVQSSTLEPAILFNECTFICPNNTALKMTNGARSEWVNCFTYFADKAIEAVSGSVGLGSSGTTRIKVSSVTGTTPAANDQLYYLDSSVSGTYSQTTTTIEITKVGHGLTVGDRVYADFTSGTATDGFYRVSGYVGLNTFQVTSATSTSTSGNVNYKEALGFGTVTAYTTSPATTITLENKGEGTFQTATSRSGKVVTPYGDAKLSTAQFKFGTASLSLDGTGDYARCEGGTDFSFAGDFTVEKWIYPTSVTGTKYLFSLGSEAAGRYNLYLVSGVVTGNFYGSSSTTFGGSISINTWTHIALVRSGSTITVYVNGTALGTTETNSSTIGNTGQLTIGADTGGANGFIGYIDTFRLSNSARYTGTFTPATSEFTSDTNTKLLLHFNGDSGSIQFSDSTIQQQDVVFVRSGVGIATATQITLADYQQFGADMRSIGSAAVFGNTGITADGLGVNLRLFAFNFGHIGSGKDFSQDISLVNQAAEVIETNGASVSYVSVDQSGDFRVGSAFYVNEEKGIVSFGGQAFNVSSLSNLTITDGTNSTILTPTSITSGNIQLSSNTVTTTSGDLTINPAGISSTFVTGDLTVTGTVFANNSLTDGNKGDITVSNNGTTWTQNTGKWGVTGAGIHTLSKVGIGTTNPRYSLEVGSVGTSGTSLYVNGDIAIASSIRDSSNVVGAAGSVLTSTSTGIQWKPIKRTVGVTVDGGGSPITTGTKGYIEVPYSGIIEEWKIISDISGSVVFDVWKSNAAIPTNANTITASAKPTLTSPAQRATSTTLTGWTTTVSENDVFGFEVESASTTTKATLILVIRQT